jgi:hypothetical protein
MSNPSYDNPTDDTTTTTSPPEDIGVRTPKIVETPTLQQASAFQFLFDYFNQNLFDGRLKQSIVGHQKGKGFGSFAPNRFVRMNDHDGEPIHEITLNPSLFKAVPKPSDPPLQENEQRTADLRELCQTLVHEMAHQADQQFGKPGKKGYHSHSWGSIMKQIGLHPSSTGAPGGDETGYHMAEYVIPNGPFEQAFNRLLREPPTIWRDAWQQQVVLSEAPARPKQKRIKYVCPNSCDFTYQASPNAIDLGACVKCGFTIMVPAA